MDTRISPGGSRTDVVLTDSAPRVTPRGGPAFREVVARGAGAVVRGAEAAVGSLPGAPLVTAALRPGGATLAVPARSASGFASPTATGAVPRAGASAAESPVAATAGEGSSVEQALAQSQEFNLYYLQLQEQMAAENRSYTAMSNVLKARHDTVKNAIGNLR